MSMIIIMQRTDSQLFSKQSIIENLFLSGKKMINMSKNEKFSLDQISNIQNFINEISKNLKDLDSSILKYNNELDKENFPATLKLLPKISLKISNLNTILKQNNEIKITHLENEIFKINTWLDEQQDSKLQENKKTKYKQFFLDNLYEKSKSRKLEFEGNFPYFRCNNFKLKLNKIKFSSTLLYGGNEEKIIIFNDWNLENILNYIKKFYEFFEKINLDDELKKIHESYMNCLKNNTTEEEWIPIMDILSEYVKIKQKNNEKLIYPERIFLSFLIHKISKKPELRVKGERIITQTATHSASTNRNQHLWIPIGTKDLLGANIMDLSFKNDIKIIQ
jgi:hypothetical protein